MLIHPEHFVKARVIHVASDDKLELRTAPRDASSAVAEVPFDSTDITAFDLNPVLYGTLGGFPSNGTTSVVTWLENISISQ